MTRRSPRIKRAAAQQPSGDARLRAWVARWAPRNSVVRIAAVFLAVLALLLPLSMFSAAWTGWAPVTAAIAGTAGALARAVGIHAQVTRNLILLPARTLEVDPECTAVDLFVVYSALVLAYPLRWSVRFIALVAGALAIQLFNLARLVAVAWAAVALSGTEFTLVHDYLFEFGMVFVIMAMWAVLISRAGARS